MRWKRPVVVSTDLVSHWGRGSPIASRELPPDLGSTYREIYDAGAGLSVGVRRVERMAALWGAVVFVSSNRGARLDASPGPGGTDRQAGTQAGTQGHRDSLRAVQAPSFLLPRPRRPCCLPPTARTLARDVSCGSGRAASAPDGAMPRAGRVVERSAAPDACPARYEPSHPCLTYGSRVSLPMNAPGPARAWGRGVLSRPRSAVPADASSLCRLLCAQEETSKDPRNRSKRSCNRSEI